MPATFISLQAWHRNPVTGWPTLLRHPFAQATRRGTGILTRCPSPTAFALGLGPTNPTRTTLASETSGLRRTRFSRVFYATHPSILTSVRSTSPHGLASTRHRTLPYYLPLPPPSKGGAGGGSAASVRGLAPLNRRRGITRPVSYYALFKGWLLLSQPPGCPSNPTSFPT